MQKQYNLTEKELFEITVTSIKTFLDECIKECKARGYDAKQSFIMMIDVANKQDYDLLIKKRMQKARHFNNKHTS